MTDAKNARSTIAHDDEYVPVDDTVIGKAFRWSILAIGLIVVVIGGVWFFRRPPEPPPAIAAPDVRPPEINKKAAEPPELAFTDVTAQAGIDFVHCNGARGDKLMPETMGSGCAFFDYDGDHDADLLLVNACWWPGEAPADAPAPTPALYQNDGTGHFKDVTADAGLNVSMYGTGVATGDFDRDGDPDVYLTAVGPNRLFRNDDGRFTDVTAAAGVAGGDAAWGTSAGFVDIDNDGDLDLFVCNYIKWSRDIDFKVNYRLTGVGRAYGPPMNFEGATSDLYRNNGDGTFTEIGREAGIMVLNPVNDRPAGKALGLCPMDFNADGWMDLFVANDTVANFLFINQKDGTFREMAVPYGLAYGPSGAATGAMGVDAGFYRGDDAMGVFIGNFANEMTSVYVSRRSELFTDEAIVEGIGGPSREALSFGLLLLDADLDGYVDLFQTNGHLEEEINQVQPSQHYEQPSQLFWNCGATGHECFAQASSDNVGDLARPVVGRAAACADIDGDGDLDLLITQSGRRPLMLRNDQSLGHNWLRIRLEGESANREGIGAEIEVDADGRKQFGRVMPTRSYLAQVELPVTFGLGAAKQAKSVTVTWPGGGKQTLTDVPAGRTLVVRQADS